MNERSHPMPFFPSRRPLSLTLRLLEYPLEGIPSDPHSICLCLATVPFLAFLHSMCIAEVITSFHSLSSFPLVCLLVYPESSLSLYFPLQALLSHRRCISRWTERGPGQRSSSPGPNCVPLGTSLCLRFFM